MPRTPNSIYTARITYGVHPATKDRLIRAAQRKRVAPGELFHHVLDRGLDNIERTERARRARGENGAEGNADA